MGFWTFPKDFVWGTATASYQVEGAAWEDGRGECIWDRFCRTPGKVVHGHNGDVACDQYHRFAEDVQLMKELGVGSYRFSIAWPRIFPTGSGERNAKGFAYYHKLIDALLEAGIAPAITLYHWDLPQTLQDAGGWPNRETALKFGDYAKVVFDELGDKVKSWITLNEPWCSAFLGYVTGDHAPGIRDEAQGYHATHHLNLGHALAVQAFRQGGWDGQIGITHNLAAIRPARDCDEDRLAADRARDQMMHLWMDPLYGRGYPERHLAVSEDRTMPIQDGDMELIAQPLDFIGINMYNESAVMFDPDAREQYKRVPTCYRQTDMGWDITPKGLYNLLKYVDATYDHPPIYVTENGCAWPDVLTDNGKRCHDDDRVDFLRRYIGWCGQAIRDGVDLRGYYCWSFIDNFEWALGYTKRFGIVYCDYLDQRRVPKDSYYYYREVIAGNEVWPE